MTSIPSTCNLTGPACSNQLREDAAERIQQAEWGNIPYDLSEWEKIKEEAYQKGLESDAGRLAGGVE